MNTVSQLQYEDYTYHKSQQLPAVGPMQRASPIVTLARPPFEMDIENLVGFFEVKLKDRRTGQVYAFPQYLGLPLDVEGLKRIVSQVTLYTFNGNNYDLPILVLALAGYPNAELKQAGDLIIVNRMKPWEVLRHYGVIQPGWIDHVDLMEVAAGVRIGLKMYGGRCHAPKIQDLPIDPNIPVPPSRFAEISEYCDNDLETTGIMRVQLKDRLALREAMSAKYQVDLRSKSDAQIAEAVIKSHYTWVDRRYIPHGYTFQYTPPAYIHFATKPLQELLEVVRNAKFVVTDKEEAIELGHAEQGLKTGVNIPPELKGRDIHIGRATYRLGIGGLHSQESCAAHYADDKHAIMDIDVTSYYPSLILGMGMFPAQLGEQFLHIYRTIFDTRLHAKAEAERIAELHKAMGSEELLIESARFKTEADGLKIVLNGTFGKLFSKYSIFYAPEFGIATTMTGQLSLLMLIEMMELSGIRVISANTDGIVLLIPTGMEWIARAVVTWWEKTTGLNMEESHYKSLHSRDVNNYVAITTSGKVKVKGIFTKPGLIENKHPDKAICAEAVVQYLRAGTPIETTIKACTDIRKFLQVRGVKGGGVFISFYGEELYLGKAVRWYYSRIGIERGHIIDKSSGNLVAGSRGCVPIMTLPESLPQDVDYAYYVDVAYRMLASVGVPVRYWHHPESSTVFITMIDCGGADPSCEEITAKMYDKLRDKYEQ